MPRLKEPEVPYSAMRMLIKSYGISGRRLADIIYCSPPTAVKKLKNPKLFTLEDLHYINKRLGIPMEEIREAVRY